MRAKCWDEMRLREVYQHVVVDGKRPSMKETVAQSKAKNAVGDVVYEEFVKLMNECWA